MLVVGRRHLDKGNPSEVDVELWTTQLDDVVAYEPAEMLVVVGPASAAGASPSSSRARPGMAGRRAGGRDGGGRDRLGLDVGLGGCASEPSGTPWSRWSSSPATAAPCAAAPAR